MNTFGIVLLFSLLLNSSVNAIDPSIVEMGVSLASDFLYGFISMIIPGNRQADGIQSVQNISCNPISSDTLQVT